MLYLYWRVIFGKLVKPALQAIDDLSLREIAILAPLVIITILMGIYPKPIFDVTSVSVANLIQQHKTALAYDHAESWRARRRRQMNALHGDLIDAVCRNWCWRSAACSRF